MLTQCRRRYRSARLARNAAPSVPLDEGELLIGVIICPNTILGCGLRVRDLEGWIVLVVKAPNTTAPMLGKCETDSPPRGFPQCFRKLKKNTDLRWNSTARSRHLARSVESQIRSSEHRLKAVPL